jgi:hypothetical protein
MTKDEKKKSSGLVSNRNLEQFFNALSGSSAVVAGIAALMSIDSGNVKTNDKVMQEQARYAKTAGGFHALLGFTLVSSSAANFLYPCSDKTNKAKSLPQLMFAPETTMALANMIVSWVIFSNISGLKTDVTPKEGGPVREKRISQVVWNLYLVASISATISFLFRVFVIWKTGGEEAMLIMRIEKLSAKENRSASEQTQLVNMETKLKKMKSARGVEDRPVGEENV